MQVWEIAILVCVSGAIGGFVNALLAGDLHLPHREGNLYSPGWIGNVVIGAVAALVFWGLYGSMAKVAVVGGAAGATAQAIFTIAELAGSVVTGIGGGRILSSEVEKRALSKTKDALTDALRP
jgi:hypothetical protein